MKQIFVMVPNDKILYLEPHLPATLKVEYLIIWIICDTDLVNKLTLQMYTLHKYK